jgi:hypothetical protein
MSIKYFTLRHMFFLCKRVCCRDILDQGIYTNRLLLQAKLFSPFYPLDVHFYVQDLGFLLVKRSGVMLPVIFNVVLNRVSLPDDMRPFGAIDLRQ